MVMLRMGCRQTLHGVQAKGHLCPQAKSMACIRSEKWQGPNCQAAACATACASVPCCQGINPTKCVLLRGRSCWWLPTLQWMSQALTRRGRCCRPCGQSWMLPTQSGRGERPTTRRRCHPRACPMSSRLYRGAGIRSSSPHTSQAQGTGVMLA